MSTPNNNNNNNNNNISVDKMKEVSSISYNIPIDVTLLSISTLDWQHPTPAVDVHKYKHWSADVDPVDTVVYPEGHWTQALLLK